MIGCVQWSEVLQVVIAFVGVAAIVIGIYALGYAVGRQEKR